MGTVRLYLAFLALVLTPAAAAALQPAPGTYRIDWHRAPFAAPMWLVQCTRACPNDGLALVANPGRFPAGSLRVLGGPYRHGADLMLDRERLVAAGLPARLLRVDVRDDRGQLLDGLALASPTELGRLAASMNGGQTGGSGAMATTAQAASVAPRPTSAICQFRYGPQAGRTVDYAGRRGIAPLAIGRRCMDADGSLGLVVAPGGSPR